MTTAGEISSRLKAGIRKASECPFHGNGAYHTCEPWEHYEASLDRMRRFSTRYAEVELQMDCPVELAEFEDGSLLAYTNHGWASQNCWVVRGKAAVAAARAALDSADARFEAGAVDDDDTPCECDADADHDTCDEEDCECPQHWEDDGDAADDASDAKEFEERMAADIQARRRASEEGGMVFCHACGMPRRRIGGCMTCGAGDLEE